MAKFHNKPLVVNSFAQDLNQVGKCLPTTLKVSGIKTFRLFNISELLAIIYWLGVA